MVKLISLLRPKRSWLQFRLKTLFVLVVVAAMPCVWMVWKMEAKRRERVAVAAIKKLGGVVCYRSQYDFETVPPGPGWLRGVFGDDFFDNVVFVSVGTDAALDHVNDLKHLETLSLWFDAASDKGLAKVEGVAWLKALHLDHAHISDSSLKHLQRLTLLEELALEGTPLSDSGLKHLRGLARLKLIFVADTQTTDSGIDEFQKALPDCLIIRTASQR